MKVLFLSVAFALVGTTLAGVAALPGELDLPKDVDLEDFSKFVGLENVEQLEQALSVIDKDPDEDVDVESRSLEARQSGQCTLKRIKQVMFDFSITQFETERNAHQGKDEPKCLNWSSDNCSLIWDKPAGFNFIPACHRHDFGTRNFKRKHQWNIVNKVRTDFNFRTDLFNECAKYTGLKNVLKRAACQFLADKYANVVAAIPLYA